MRRYRIEHSEEGQSLVLILVVLVIGAIVAFAIAARTIQDIRRTGEERISSQAGTLVETALDITTSAEVWADIWDADALGFKNDVCLDPYADICCIVINGSSSSAVGDYFDDLSQDCNEQTVCLRLEDTVVEHYIQKDDVFELNLATAADPGSFTITMNPDDTSAARMIVKVYRENEGIVTLRDAVAYCEDCSWGSSGPATISYNPDDGDKFVRIRAVGSGMTISTDNGLPPQEVSARVTCTISGIYREFVRAVPLYSYLPACFDYVLFDGSTKVEDFETF
jgi:hypothetical protein